MKKYIFIASLFVTLCSNAQSTYEAARLLESDLTGTARFVGMGGSMSALGADVTVMGTNPAGIAVYRGNDVSVSASLNTLNNKADYLGTKRKSDKTYLSFDNLGLVIANRLSLGGIEFLNLGVNYKHRNNFSKEFAMAGAAGYYKADNKWVQFSQQYQMQALYNISPFDASKLSYRNYTDLNDFWLPLLGYDGGVIDENGAPIYLPDAVCYYSEEKGGVDQVDCNISFNINDRIYIGATLGFYNVDYGRYSYYGEYDAEGEIYTLHNWYETKGTGFDVKLGAIFRPFEESSFKLGFAVHTPTWYNLTDRTSAKIVGLNGNHMDTRDYEYAYGDDYYVDYRMLTPWRLNVSTSYVFDNFLALNAEYEYTDFSNVAMEYSDGFSMHDLEDEFSNNMKAVNTFRIGAELRLSDNFSMRGGYNYISAPFDKYAAKYIISTANTATEYQNNYDMNIFTFGLGYNYKNFYVDFAYKYSMLDADFYPYYDSEIVNPSSVKTERNQFMFTLGGRF